MKTGSARWFDARARRAQLDEEVARSAKAHFGYAVLPSEEKAAAVRRHFQSVAGRYDFMNSLLSFGIQHVWKRRAVRLLSLRPGDRVLDVCGGTGDLALLAAGRIGPLGRAVICDINPDMILAGLPKFAGTPLEARIACVQADAERLPFPVGAFDAAVLGFGVRNITHIRRAFAELYRVLKPGGRLVCLEFSKPTNAIFRAVYDGYSFFVMPLLGRLFAGSAAPYLRLPETIRTFLLPDEFARLLESVGFEALCYRRLTNGIACIHKAIKRLPRRTA